MAERIADAAMTVIARDGHDALSVRRVAHEVSVTGGTVQHHYPTKIALTVAALDRCVSRQSKRVLRRSGRGSEVAHLIRGVAALLSSDEGAQMIEAGLDGMMLAGISESYGRNTRARRQLGVLVRRLLLVDAATFTSASAG